mmetsp:Transcript_34731/g.97469  ORF Transcript_34731/g.97469 Transcript_34731/m.97469 type:complete len:224 (-) Transcript_34731:82-753(-)
MNLSTRLAALLLAALVPSLHAMRSTGAAAGVSEEAGNSTNPCTTMVKRIKRVSNGVKAAAKGCQQRGGPFCCDSWLMTFNKKMRANFKNEDIKLQLWRWTIRPGRKRKNLAHEAKMLWKNPGTRKAGKIGIDSHYFTVVEYCPGKFRIFDTVSDPQGREVDAAFLGDSSVLGKNFEYYYADKLGGKPKQCAYGECVVECTTEWLKPEELSSSAIPKCMFGIVL